MTDKQKINNEYWKNKYADIHIRLTNKIAELQEQLQAKEQECEKAKNIIKEALSDFYGEIGTKEYIKLTKEAKELGIEVKDYE